MGDNSNGDRCHETNNNGSPSTSSSSDTLTAQPNNNGNVNESNGNDNDNNNSNGQQQRDENSRQSVIQTPQDVHTREKLFDFIALLQGRRMDDQRAILKPSSTTT